MASSYRAVKIEKGDGIAWLYMNRPDKKNAMNPAMHVEMTDALNTLAADDETQVVVLTGAGDAFCSGQDLKEFFRDLDGKPKERARIEHYSNEWRSRLLGRFPKTTIAMVNGWCCGGGFTQLISCDLAIAAEQAQFSISEVNWGILPGGLVAKALADCIGYRDALYYIMTADTFDGNKAAAMGLVNYAVPLAQLRDETEALARKMLEKNPHTIRAAKEAYRAVRKMDERQAEDYLAAKSAQLMSTDPERGRERGMHEFLDTKAYRPGMAPYPR